MPVCSAQEKCEGYLFYWYVLMVHLPDPQLMGRFLAISEVQISFCEHNPPGVSLVNMGAFSSTPVRPPKWAFDIQLLEYMSKQFAYGTPDISAWCHATSSFLSSRGVEKVPSPVRHSHSFCPLPLTSVIRMPCTAQSSPP
jgi:hypothetical protein